MPYNALVRDEKIASSTSSWYSGLALDTGHFGVYALAAGDAKLEDIEASMDRVIDGIVKNGVTPEELERAKTAEIANLIYASDSQQSLAHSYGWALTYGPHGRGCRGPARALGCRNARRCKRRPRNISTASAP